jgi:hypothetical protein
MPILLEDARAKSKRYGYITDALGAATVVLGAVALYLAVTSPGAPPRPQSSKVNTSLVLAPTVGGGTRCGQVERVFVPAMRARPPQSTQYR